MMIDSIRSTYAAPLVRAVKQAPWRSQTQAVAILSITLLTAAVVGGFYLAVSARAATAGRDLQALEAQKAELTQNNDELRAQLAQLRSVTRLAARAQELGFQPATGDQLEYLRVDSFPQTTKLAPPPRAAVLPPPPNTLAVFADWLVQTARRLAISHGWVKP